MFTTYILVYHGGQKRLLGLQVVVSHLGWEGSNSGHLKEQEVLLVTEPWKGFIEECSLVMRLDPPESNVGVAGI